MSWFDATSFTSYAKTALASAQKSIDKALDIDGAAGSQTTKTTSKGEGDKVERITTLPSSAPSSTVSPPKTTSSKEKLSLKNDGPEASGGDFWSSFLGSSQSDSSSSSSSSTNKTTNTKKSSRQRDSLSRKISDSKLTAEKQTKETTETKTEITGNKDIRLESKIDSTRHLDSNKTDLLGITQETNSKKTPRKNKISQHNESKPVDELSTDQSHEQTSSKILDHNVEDKMPSNDECLVEVSLVNNGDEIDKTDDINKESDSKSQGIDLDPSGYSWENDIKVTVGELELELPTGYQEYSPANEASENEPMATSTPYSGKDRPTTSPELESITINNDVDAVDNNDRHVEEVCDAQESMTLQTDVESQNTARKEPIEVEDEDEIHVVKGVMFKAEDGTFDEELINDGTANVNHVSDENNSQLMELIKETGGSDSDESMHLTVPIGVEENDGGTRRIEQEVGEDGNQVQQLLKEISSLKEVVNARENKMVDLSKENIDFQETNTILKSQIEQLENMHAGENEEFEEMREEFTTRIATAENKLHDATEERDQMRTELDETTARLTAINERQTEEFSTLITEKDEQIAQLLSEGEKLSKQELQSNTVIKKLRTKEKENDTLIKKQSKKLEEYEEEVKRLTEILTSRDDSNSKQGDAIIKLNVYVKKQEEQLAKHMSELEDANEKVRSMQVALDNAYKEMTTLQKQTASTDSTIQEAVLSTEVKAKEGLRISLEKARREFQQESEMMALQVTDLQTSLSRTEQQSTRREDNLRQEIKHLQQRLQEGEDRNQELASSVSLATRPLLRQIENLQTTHGGQALTWEKVEKNLTERQNEAQKQLLMAQEKERVASQNVSELNTRTTRLESQVNSYRAERSRLEANLELERTKNGTLEDAQSRETSKYDAMVKKYKKIIEDANLDKAHLEQQLTVEKSKMATEVKKLKYALEDKEKLLSRQSSFSSIVLPSANSESFPFNQQQDTTDNTSHWGHARTSSSGSKVVEGIARGVMGGTTALVERLQAQVRQKDGEIELLQEDVTSLRQSRDSIMEELTSMTRKLEDLEISHEKLKDLKKQYDEIQQRYNAVLQMYGEKEEEAEELRMDLQDVKCMYKQQLEQLFGSAR